MKSTLHIVSHTHWDREWYMSFEQHRLRLVALIDMLLDIFDAEPDFRHFHMDGQMIPYEDYLAVRPDRLEDVKRAVAQGKLSLGPWYVLQDEALTSAEANVRNLMYGMKLARRFGEPLMVGYLPDTFGHFSQMPQILRGFGIDNAVFGRGVNRYSPQKAKNPETDPGEAGFMSELGWRSPDGSEVLGVFMANWYSNAMDIPPDPDDAAEFLARSRDNAAHFATTSQLLLMNGCDHTPTRPDVGRVIESARDRIADDVVHTDLASYMDALRDEVGQLQTVKGELRSDYTDGWGTLADTLSARMYEKQANYRCQVLLEQWAEPLAAFASAMGDRHPSDELWYAWATLMKNHPHDSICGCSCDEVHREMDVRFEKAEQVACALRDGAAQSIGNRIDTSFAPDGAATVTVLNPSPSGRSENIAVEVQFPEDADVRGIEATDVAGNTLLAVPEMMHPEWSYQLPDDRFRTPYNCRRVRCHVHVPNVPGMGYSTISVRPASGQTVGPEQRKDSVLENEFLRVEVRPRGVLNITEKQSGITFEGINILEDGGDCGNEYIYRAPAQDRVLTTDSPSDLSSILGEHQANSNHEPEAPVVVENGLGCAATVSAYLPAPLWSDAQERGDVSGIVMVRTELLLGREDRHLQVRMEIDNEAEDHRLRALFPTGICSDHCYADSQFDIVQRPIKPWHGWKNPSNPQPQQAFVDVCDADGGLCIANRGLPSYEVLRDGRNTIALTLLRAVGELGDWGQFPTPEAQCTGPQAAEYAIIPHSGHIMDADNCDAARIAWNYANPMWAIQTKHFMYPHKERWCADLPAEGAFVSVDPHWLALSSVRKPEDRDGLIVRVYNPFETPTQAKARCLWPVREAYLTNLAEQRQRELDVDGQSVQFEVGAKKIVTVELVV